MARQIDGESDPKPATSELARGLAHVADTAFHDFTRLQLTPGEKEELARRISRRGLADLEARLEAAERERAPALREKVRASVTAQLKLLKRIKEASGWQGPSEDEKDLYSYLHELKLERENFKRERDEALAEVQRLRPYEQREVDLVQMRNRCEHVPVPSGYGHVCSVCGLEL